MIKHIYPNEHHWSLWRGLDMVVSMGEPCCPWLREGWKAGKGFRTPGVSGQHWEKIPWKQAMSQKQTGRMVGEGSGEQWDGLMTCLDFRRAACFRGITPHSRKVSFGWKSRTRVLRSIMKGLNKPVFLTTGNRHLLFTIWRYGSVHPVEIYFDRLNSYSPIPQSPDGVSPWTKVSKDHPDPFCVVQLLQWGWRKLLFDQPEWKPPLWICTTTIITDSPH